MNITPTGDKQGHASCEILLLQRTIFFVSVKFNGGHKMENKNNTVKTIKKAGNWIYGSNNITMITLQMLLTIESGLYISSLQMTSRFI